MTAYVIVEADVLDEAAAHRYNAVAIPSIQQYGGRYLVKGETPDAVEGEWPSARLIVLEFPDMDRIKEWYSSPEYTRAREIREQGIELRMLFAEGAA